MRASARLKLRLDDPNLTSGAIPRLSGHLKRNLKNQSPEYKRPHSQSVTIREIRHEPTGTREINTLIVGRALTGIGAFV